MLRDVLRKFGSLVAPPAGTVARAAGRVWHLSPEGEALFGRVAPPLDAWLADGSAAVVKSGPHRTVYRIALPAGVVYVKHCRINGPRAWAREVLRAPKARLEFENATRLRALGIGAAVPLAWGTPDTRWPGQSYLITRDLAPALPFTEFVETATLTPGERRALARGMGAFLARLHECGISHPDPHPGNVLVAWEAERPTPQPPPCREGEPEAACGFASATKRDAREAASGQDAQMSSSPSLQGGGWGVGLPHFSLLDVHAIRFGPPLGWAASRANLVLFNRWFQLRASRADRARFWRSYLAGRPLLATAGAAEAKEVERVTPASNRRMWAARTTRYKGTHRSIRRVRAGSVRGMAVRDLPDDFLRVLLADPDALFEQPGTKFLKRCIGSTVAEVEMPTPDGPRAVVLKRVNLRSIADPLKNLVRSSAVMRSWLFGHGLRERWLPTARPLAVLHRYRGGLLPAEGYLLTEKVPDALGLPEAVRACRDPRVLRAWATRLARVVRAMHDRGVSHRDLKAPNVMLANAATDPANATPVLIDLVGVRAGAADVPFARRAKELARLNASFLTMPHATRAERLRFLRAYLGWESGADWKVWWKAVAAATEAKMAKNRRSGRVLG